MQGSGRGPVLLQFDSIQSLHSHLDKMMCNVVPASPSPLCFHVVSHSFLVAASPVNAIQPTVQRRNGSVNTVPLAPRFKIKKKRGRPKKYIDPSVKRKPGRPRKHHFTEDDQDHQHTETQALPKEEDLVVEDDASRDVEEILEPRLNTSSFGQKLEAELERPFDGSELERMEIDVRHRKPVVKLRQTRQGSVPFQTENVGNSYLDHFPDFAEALSLSSSPENSLGLLRGFFFWLQHSCMTNSFKPWLSEETTQDPQECHEITPNDEEIFDMNVVLQL